MASYHIMYVSGLDGSHREEALEASSLTIAKRKASKMAYGDESIYILEDGRLLAGKRVACTFGGDYKAHKWEDAPANWGNASMWLYNSSYRLRMGEVPTSRPNAY